MELTHAIDIEAPPEEVWPWLMQMGRRRAGWYSWDLLDNGGVDSADRIIPELQDLAIGDVLPVKAEGPEGFAVLLLDPPHALVLGDPSLLPGRPKPTSTAPRVTWAFSLEPRGAAATHLVVRVRAELPPSLGAALARPIIRVVHGVMERKQLRTLKRRAEAGRRAPRGRLRARIEALVGAGDRIMLSALPPLVLGLAANLLWPSVFRMGLGTAGAMVGATLLTIGVPLWLTAVVQILNSVPKGRLITTGPFAIMLHPIYTSVALLVLPGLGLAFDSWLGFAAGAMLYLASRRFAPREERELAEHFGEAYAEYRRCVLLPWL